MQTNKKLDSDSFQILIVEDSPTQAEQLKYTLENKNYEVSVAKDGKMALNMLKKFKPNLVISDIVMPEMNGYDLCKEIKSMESTMDIPVILLTSLTNAEDVLEGLACGADNFLTKPYNDDYLLSHIDRIIATRKFGNSERVRVGVEIIFGGKKRFITADQQQMLTLLISTYEAAVQRNHELTIAQEELKTLNDHLEEMVEERTVELKFENSIRKQAEIQVNKLNRVYALLSNVNQTIVRVSEKQTLFEDTCRIAIEDGKFRMAWIGMVDKQSNKFIPVAASGHANEYIKTINIDLNDKILGDGPIGRSIKTGKHYLANDIANDPEMVPWRENALKLGCKSSAAFPIIVFGEAIGAFIIYSDELFFFDEAEVKLLDEMSSDVSFALEFLEKESKRKLAEESLKKSELKYKALFDEDLTGDYLAAVDGTILLCNKTLANIFGFNSVNSLLNENIISFYKDPDSREGFLNLIREKKKLELFEREFILRDGRQITVLQNVVGEFDEYGTLINLKGYLFDITERKLAMKALILAKEKAEESDRLKTSFLNNISHEIRTPLNGILGFANLITDSEITQEEKEFFLNTLNISSDRLLKTITNYIDISLIVSSNMEVHVRPFDLALILTNAQEYFQPQCLNKNLELKVQIPDPNDYMILNTDSELLNKALFHLVDNAIKFTKEGCIEIGFATKAYTEPDRSTITELVEIEFFVKDSGIGVAKEALEQIFISFSQENSSNIRGHEGSGLGLTIANGIVELLGGKIRLESEKNKGTSVFVSIPVELGILPEKARYSGFGKTRGKSPIILVAEDNDQNFFYLEIVLKNIENKILRAVNGQEAVDLCKKHPEIALILMDIKMPVMNGLDATRIIKSFRKDLPIVAVTAYAQSSDKYNIREAGCDDYLSKPINKTLLLQLIKKYFKA